MGSWVAIGIDLEVVNIAWVVVGMDSSACDHASSFSYRYRCLNFCVSSHGCTSFGEAESNRLEASLASFKVEVTSGGKDCIVLVHLVYPFKVSLEHHKDSFASSREDKKTSILFNLLLYY